MKQCLLVRSKQGLGWNRVCEAQRSNESPGGAFKRQRGLRQQMEGRCPDKCYNHFKTIAESIPETPVLLYNNPGRVGCTMSAKLVEELAHNVPNIVGMKDTRGDITQTAEFIRRTRDVGFKVFGGKDTLLYASLCHGAVGGVCTAANFMPELITDVYNKYAAGDLAGSLEAQFKLNPVRLSMDAASFPVAAKDMANLRGRKVGVPYLPTLPTPEGAAKQGFVKTMTEAGLL